MKSVGPQGLAGSNPVCVAKWLSSIVANAPDCLSGYRGFESHLGRHNSGLTLRSYQEMKTDSSLLVYQQLVEVYAYTSHNILIIWLLRLAVRTRDFHSRNSSSILLGVTICWCGLMVRQLICNQLSVGSNPITSSIMGV